MEDKPGNSVLIVGCGYIGRRVAALLTAQQCAVTGMVRSPESVAALKATGIDGLCADLDAGLPDISADEIYYFAPPPRDGDRDTRMSHFLAAITTAPRRIVYISTSAVYGDCSGAWITEQQPVSPTTGRGRRRLDAERQLIAWSEANDAQWLILRVPGIYGPGKLPLARLRKGLPVLREADAPWTNRIHGDDLAAICVAAMQSAHANTVYNVSDGHPSNMTDYFFRVADAAGLPHPPQVSPAEAETALSAGMLSFLNDSRRMNNDKLLRELDISLQYPELAAGLKSCFTD
ncbi:MAG: SDR family oxidoreductase [Gammaproteobacteria bacterium]|nr:SDR family oxidoreductase [Gammaproteobacteria bacterium]